MKSGARHGRGDDSHEFVAGVDIGGTFTDAVLVDAAGEVSIGKAPSTPPNFERGFLDALAAAGDRCGLTLEHLLERTRGIYHACTVGTNALVEGRGAQVALLTTQGHRDSLFYMQAGARHFGLTPEQIARVAGVSKPEPLVPKRLIAEVQERIAFDGAIVVDLDVAGVRATIEELREQGVQAYAIAFLWSAVNPVHELRVAELVRELVPGAFVSVSSQLSARQGEYQRTVAAVINGLIGPAMTAYLGALESELSTHGYADPLWIMSCSGGVISAEHARNHPILTIGSGPVAGLAGAASLTSRTRHEVPGAEGGNLITADMGGTTFDVGVVRSGRPLSRSATRYRQYEYFVPTLDVRSIGAGGGSVIRYEATTRTLRVGPTSAGARPGPAAYLLGGTEATVTDADLVLGYLNPAYFLGGRLELHPMAASDALERAGRPLGFGPEQAAAAAARIVDSQMADAIRLASIQQGYDPRESTMLAYGGAGPVHATAIARQLGIRRVTIPLGDLAAGWSAFGAASSDAIVVQELPVALEFPFDVDVLNEGWRGLEARVAEYLEGQHLSDNITSERLVEIRYAAQINTVEVVAPDGLYDNAVAQGLIATFESEYVRLFGEGAGYPDAGFMLTALRVRARAPLGSGDLASHDRRTVEADGVPPLKLERDVVFYREGPTPIRTPVYEGDEFARHHAVAGPAIIEFLDTTVVLGPGERATMDAQGSLTIAMPS